MYVGLWVYLLYVCVFEDMCLHLCVSVTVCALCELTVSQPGFSSSPSPGWHPVCVAAAGSQGWGKYLYAA